MFRFTNYEFDICSFIAFQAFLQCLKKSLSGWIALSCFRTTGPRLITLLCGEVLITVKSGLGINLVSVFKSCVLVSWFQA